MISLSFIDSKGTLISEPADNAYFQSVISFLEDFRGNPEITVRTSGSTGKPKEIIIKKEQIYASVSQTASAFNLKSDDIAFCSLPIDYIAGKLMVLRAEILGLHAIITEPSAEPFLNFSESTFSFFEKNAGKFLFAFVPYQLEKILNNEKSISVLNNAKVILSGGAPLSKSLEEKLTKLNTQVYETYGMTETVTHLAIRKVSEYPGSSQFNFLSGIEHKTSADKTLAVKGAVTNSQWVQTNDVIEYTGTNSFKLLGRIDNVINSGGIKLHPEQIEQKIQKIFDEVNITNKFFCTGKTDVTLGKTLVLFIEKDPVTQSVDSFFDLFRSRLPKYEVPKEIILTNNFVYTSSNKINRKQTAQTHFL